MSLDEHKFCPNVGPEILTELLPKFIGITICF
jgi:hypothetical protein